MVSSTAKTAVSLVIIVAGLVAVFALSDFVNNQRPPLPEGYADQDLALQGGKLKGFAFGSEGLLADWYWMRSLQYIGDKLIQSGDQDIDLGDLRPLNPRLLYPYLNTATDLDPGFIAAYSYGAIVLPAIDPQKAIEITEKGIANNPTQWRLYGYLGYIYWRQEQYAQAAEVYEKGAQIPGAAPFMALMAAKVKSDGGSRETGREMYKNILENTNDPQIQESIALHLLRIDSLDELDVINPVLKTFSEQSGKCPVAWNEVARSLSQTKVAGNRGLRFDRSGNVLDPMNVPYKLIAENGVCRADIDRVHSKIPNK